MLQFKDAFISYSRRNLDFARRLHDTLSSYQLDVWFDQHDIPLAVDFQHHIDEGIRKADNFIFIISPDSIKSSYCTKEINMAVWCGKRIIPILYEMPANYEMSYMDTHIEKLNWIYMREEDDFDTKIQALLNIFDLHKSYVKHHTELLNAAIDWEEHSRSSQLLLVNKERKVAEQWLLQEFNDNQPPCSPPDLVCEYICESRQNGENLLSDVFISSHKEDKKHVALLNQVLQRYAYTTWTSEKDLKIGTNYEVAMREGIEQADNFMIVLSSHVSFYDDCMKELEYAASLNKRIIPILVEDIPTSQLHPLVKDVQAVHLYNILHNKSEIADKLFGLLDEEASYYQEHKLLLVQALRWSLQHQNQSILLRGYRLDEAETWLRIHKNRRNQPPLPIHKKFIDESIAKKGQLTTEVFVSYSRTDSDFARKLNNELQIYGKTTWFDQENISAGLNFQQEIYNGIAAADNFLFVISPEAVNSPFCVDEVNYAQKLNKRFITILSRQTDTNQIPRVLRELQWIDATSTDFHHVFSELIRALDTDKNHVQQHTKWATRAAEWEQKDKDHALLLRGSELNRAVLWLRDSEENQKKPAPTEAQIEFIKDSEKAQTETAKKEQNRKRAFRMAIWIGSIAAVVVATYFINEQIDIKNLKKEREVLAQTTFELIKEKEILKEKEDSLNMLLGYTRKDLESTKTSSTARLSSVHQARMTAEQQFSIQRRRADSLQRTINARFLPMQAHLQDIHQVKKDLDAINFKLSQFIKFDHRLNPNERGLLNDLLKEYNNVEKKLEGLTK